LPIKRGPRIVVEYLQQLLKPYHISIEVQYLPWNRAIREVMTGHISGLVTAVPSEAPNLSFTSTATMKYGVCLYSRSSSNWQYTDISSLEDQILGGALNYSYDEVIDSYIEKNKDKSNITFLTGKNKVSRFSSMLTSN
jgi:polar amino acid transport system substrate-binding protein